MAQQGNLFLEQFYQEIEMEMLENIGRMLSDGLDGAEEEYVQWQIEKLSQLGVLREQQLQIIAKYAGVTVGEIKKYIHEHGIAEIEAFDGRMDSLIDAGVAYVPPTNTVYDRLFALEQQGESIMNMINSNLLRGSEQVYRDILTKASTDMLLGNTTLYQSVVAASREWANRGIPVLIDSAGRRWSVEAYVSMVVRNTQKNVAVEMQEARMDDYDIDLVEISSHRGSRPSHIDYQGRIYSRSGTSDKYPPLSSTSYGAIDGIVTGINCGHMMYPFIEGLSTQRYTPYDKEESEEVYKQSQRQRYLERQIRRAKKEKAMLEAMNAKEEDIQRAGRLIRKRQATIREFIKESGRTRRYNREQIQT